MYNRMVAVDTELNITPEAVCANILCHTYGALLSMNLEPNFSTLYITGEMLFNDSIEISPECFFLSNGVTMTETPVMLPMMNAWYFLDQTVIDSILRDKYQFKQIIVGPINCIPEEVLNNILNYFDFCEIFLYGDPLVDAPEYFNYHMKYLTNANLTIRIDYGTNRISQKKKINNVLTKLRKDGVHLSDISINSLVSINNDNNISYSFIKQYLEEDPSASVIVPKRLHSLLNSDLYHDIYGRDDLSPQLMDEYFLKYPLFFNGTIIESGPNGVSTTNGPLLLSAMVRFRICYVYGNYINPINSREYVRVDIQLVDTGYILKEVSIDLDDFFLQFNPEMHPQNMESYRMIEQTYRTNSNYFLFDPYSAKICISRMCISDQMKYFRSTKLLDYIELVERDSNFDTDTNWYKHFCNTLDEIDIIYCDEF